jgi:GlpG protein
MRQIAILQEQTARTFADYLLTLKIRTQLLPDEGGTAVWVCDEDQVSRARQELAEFQTNPADTRYRSAGAVADSLRKQEAHLEKSYRKRQESFRRKMQNLGVARAPVTIALLLISIGLTLATHFGRWDSPLLQYLFMASFEIKGNWITWHYLSEIASGQVWRLVTPIFVHLNVIHLVFNMMMLVSLGAAVELRRGWVHMILLVLVLAIGSNLVQYYLGHPSFENWPPSFQPSPFFGGMSGVLYGLFGYAWMKSRYESHLGLYMPRETALAMIVWFVLCLTGVLGSIANGAHAGGLFLGLLIGFVPVLWRRLRGRD